MNGVIYFCRISEEKRNSRTEHAAGEELLKKGLKEEYGLELRSEKRGVKKNGKPYFPCHPEIHYNISHSGKYVVCAFADEEIGIDIQKHRTINYAGMLKHMVPDSMIREILESDNPEKSFFSQWVLREAYIKWTGEGLLRDMRTISMDEGVYVLLDLEEGYSCAVWTAHPVKLSWKETRVFPGEQQQICDDC